MDNDEMPASSGGYKKPPRDKQFKKGQSGNPKGRPKGSKNLSIILAKELNTKIPVTENGKQKQITKQEAIVKGTVNNALRGDHKATAVIWSDLRSREDQTADRGSFASGKPVNSEDELVMESIVRRILASHAAPIESPNPAASESEVDLNTEPKEGPDDSIV